MRVWIETGANRGLRAALLSKMASGPMLFSFIVGAGDSALLIATAMALLALATVASAIPTWVLDHGADCRIARDATHVSGIRSVHREYVRS